MSEKPCEKCRDIASFPCRTSAPDDVLTPSDVQYVTYRCRYCGGLFPTQLVPIDFVLGA